jgi:diguanylate cyclase (GGDEF)-like protein
MPSSALQVMVMEPDRVWRARLTSILAGHGMLVRVAETPAEALATAAEESGPIGQVAIALVSVEGPSDEGIDLMRQIARLGPQRPALVAMSASGGALVQRAVKAGADDYLIAPTGTEELLTRLQIVSERRRLDAEQVMLRRLAVDVAEGREHSHLCGLVARELAMLLAADGGRVVRYTGIRHAVLLGAWRRSDFEQIPPGELLELAPSWALAQVQRTGRPARSELTPEDAKKARAPVRASLAAPVRVEGSLWGAVAVAYSDPAAAHEEALSQLERVAELISLAVSNAEAREELSRMARTDPLTGLLNHGAFHERLEEETARAARHGRPLSLALLDIDHFKLVNDLHGHRVGDETLRAVAHLMGSHAREVDVVGRVGGEELALLMPDSALAGAAEAAERLRAVIAATPLGAAGTITASIGVAQLWPGGSGTDLFGQADSAMYSAKASGRNCVRAAPEPPSADRESVAANQPAFARP